MKSVESVGKNVELAIENGLKELNVTRDKVTIKVIDAGGIFKKAKVVLTLDSDGEDLEQKRSDNIKRLEELERQGKLDNDFSNLLNSKSILNGESKTVEESLDNQTEAKATCGCEVNKFENCKSCESVVQNNENEVQELSKGASEINKFAKELLTKREFDASVEI
ncbi:MAG: Jag N-terminal domain-containing protein, partial [Christensenellales bacterium]